MSENRRLPRQFLVRTTSELGAAIEAAATEEGISSAAWLRRLAAWAVRETTVPQDVQRSPRRRARPHLEAAEVELRAVVRDLGRLTGATVQLAKALRETARPEHPTAEQVLTDVREATRAAAALVERLK